MKVEEIHSIGFLSKLLETKLMQVLRFKHGQVFTVRTLFSPFCSFGCYLVLTIMYRSIPLGFQYFLVVIDLQGLAMYVVTLALIFLVIQKSP